MQAVIAKYIFNKNGGSIPVCTERKATGLFVLVDFLCDNGKHVFPKGSNDRYTVGEFFSVPVFTNVIQDTMRKLKKNTQNESADFSPQF